MHWFSGWTYLPNCFSNKSRCLRWPILHAIFVKYVVLPIREPGGFWGVNWVRSAIKPPVWVRGLVLATNSLRRRIFPFSFPFPVPGLRQTSCISSGLAFVKGREFSVLPLWGGCGPSGSWLLWGSGFHLPSPASFSRSPHATSPQGFGFLILASSFSKRGLQHWFTILCSWFKGVI